MDFRSAHTRLLVFDLKACSAFYKDVMGFDVTVDDEQAGYVEFKVGEMRLALFRRQEMAEMIGNADMPANAECQDKVVLIFTVTDLDEVHHQLTHKGVKFTTEPMGNPYYGIKTAYLRDPDQNLIGIYQFLD